jgi:membrane-bound serine protease (ClpP class)
MDPVLLSFLLFAAAAVLLVAELGLPSHGVLGLLGAVCIMAGVGVVFYLRPWAGLALAAGLAVATPFAIGLWLKIWPKTPLGRRLILSSPATSKQAPAGATAAAGISIGQTGITASELRPGGTCDFGGERVACHAEHGLIPTGTPVRVIAVMDGRPVVRPA